MTKPDFERVKSAKSFEKYKQLHPDSEHEFTITDRPIEFKKTYEDIIKDEDEAHICKLSKIYLLKIIPNAYTCFFNFINLIKRIIF